MSFHDVSSGGRAAVVRPESMAGREGPPPGLVRLLPQSFASGERLVACERAAPRKRRPFPGSAGFQPAWTFAFPGSAGFQPAWTTAFPGSAGFQPAWTTAFPGSAGFQPAWTFAFPGSAGFQPAWTFAFPGSAGSQPAWTTAGLRPAAGKMPALPGRRHPAASVRGTAAARRPKPAARAHHGAFGPSRAGSPRSQEDSGLGTPGVVPRALCVIGLMFDRCKGSGSVESRAGGLPGELSRTTVRTGRAMQPGSTDSPGAWPSR